MILALLIGCVVTAATFAQATSPLARLLRGRIRRGAGARRVRFLADNPTYVEAADIVAALRLEGLTAEQARFVTAHAQEQGIKPFTLWLWLAQFGAEIFSIAVVADLTQAALLSHISSGTLPDVEELTVLASANGLDASCLPALGDLAA